MTGAGSILWIIAIGALVYFMMRKGGGCCGTDHGQEHDHQKNCRGTRRYTEIR